MWELAPPDELLLPRDAEPALYVPAAEYGCRFCAQPPPPGTTVDWLPQKVPDGIDGRCRECGQKWILARWREAVPTVEEQLRARGRPAA